MYKTILQEEKSRFEEKKSVFLSFVLPIKTVQEATEKIQFFQKSYADARHVVYAYTVLDQESGQHYQKFSDDGEPAGTAGKPILEVLRKEEVENVLLIVVRYFGGVLLGAGGLTRAYTRGAVDVLSLVKYLFFAEHAVYQLSLPYSLFSSFEHFAKKQGVVLEKIKYEEKVHFSLALLPEEVEACSFFLKELSHGQENMSFLGMEQRALKK